MVFEVIRLLDVLSRPVLSWFGAQVMFSTVVFILVWTVTKFFRLRDPYWLTALWALIPVRLVIPPSFYSPVALSTFINKLIFSNSTVYATWPDAESVLRHSNIISSAGHMKPMLLTTFPWAFLVMSAWLAGIMTLILIYIRRIMRRRALIRDATLVTNSCLRKVMRQYAISLPVRLLVCTEMISPFTTGWRSPVICIPRAFLKHTALQYILAHEMAHIKRRDSLLLALQSFIMIVYFFDPLLWITSRRINFYRECLCDRLALETGQLDPVRYGKGLLKVLSVMAAKPEVFSASPALGHYHKELTRRFQLLTGGISMRSPKKWHRMALVFILVFTILPFARSGEMQSLNSEGKIPDTVEKTAIQFINPLPSGKITLGFGPARDPFTGEPWKHNGIDLKAIVGEPVKACADGQVIEAVEEYVAKEGRGIYITIQHQDGFCSNYSHLQSIQVKKGDQVHSGDVIATVGNTGRSTGPHLHFELIKDGEPIDPQGYIEFKK